MRIPKKTTIMVVALLLLVAAGIWVAWYKLASPTRIALVNFQPFQTAGIIKANDDSFVRYEEVPLDRLATLSDYDFVLGFGMGLRIDAAQRAQIERATSKGVPVFMYAVTNPQNNIGSLDSVRQAAVKTYLNNGNKKNYRNLARYVRQHIDGKRLFVTPADTAVTMATDVLYHLDDEVWFDNVPAYERYLAEHGYAVKGGPKVAIVGGLNDPFSGNRDNIDSLIVSFWKAGFNVYPVSSTAKRLDYIRAIDPDAVLYFPHGRLAMGRGDAAVEWLKARNVPLFAPLSLLRTQQAWEDDPMGLFGGFLSQSVVMPELDGAIYPYAINAQELDDSGVYLFKAIPGRLEKFTRVVDNFIRLKRMANADKRVAIYFFKGPGQSTLAAQGLETVPSLYHLLKRMKAEGYKVDNLPADEAAFEKLLMSQGEVLSTYAEGAFDNFLKNGDPALVEKSRYESWARQAMRPARYDEVVSTYGEAPGRYMSVDKDGKRYLAVARIQLGNIALLPQPMAALGSDGFAIAHGAKMPPPHTYIGAYLWSRYAFEADALLHFGTHGSLEFTPAKQVALSDNDWPDILVGTVPHFYYYTIGNVGESMMAKRRSYATTLSYLTPPFMESDTRTQFKALDERVRAYYKADEGERDKASLAVKKIAVRMGIHRELRLDSVLTVPYSEEEIERVENFAEEIATEKMNGAFYTTGVPYPADKISSTVYAMATDPIAYGMAALDRLRGSVDERQLARKAYFTEHYLAPAKAIVARVLGGQQPTEAWIAQVSGIDKLADKESKEAKRAIAEIERAIGNVSRYQTALRESPEQELNALLNALSGGYTPPTSGGDAVANPGAVPTGRNLYAVNAEATPSAVAWEKGVSLAQATLEQYRKQHGDYPRKVSYTFWSSEFIETEGATIAQALYMLGVEPVRDPFGRVSDLKLIASEALGRPRVDVVVQTSGQFRDLAASRLALISRAVKMAAASSGEKYDNYVNSGAVETERLLVEQGVPPREAREASVTRVFGGINGMYGTGIQAMTTAGDKWENESEIADTYLHNMGAAYTDDKSWGDFREGLLRAVLHNTDAVVQPRQSNTWGALSLDHVYEFMGGMNLAVRDVTGKDPEAYFADYRNRNRVKMQEVKEAIGVESRTTLFNPAYIKEVMKGHAASASQITELVTNTYGWNVMKPAAIDNAMWDKLYDVYVQDEYKLGTEAFFRRESPQALQEITAVMLETARKGMWKASPERLSRLADLHTRLVEEFGSSGAGFSGGNAKLQDFIAGKVDERAALAYREQLEKMRIAPTADQPSQGMVLHKEEIANTPESETNQLDGLLIAAVVLVAFVVLLAVLKRKRKR
ncbi:MAG: cobaltochelatase subunit CobN [Mediterranea sp.]|jgi:cobaltochelatase CobN|nr:cobaltochelatase subunit CobN [Mediterranea sp.]